MTRDPVHAGDLARLLETERRLGERLQSARAEADALVAHAREAAAQREARLAAELESDQRSMADRLLGERAKREHEIADTAQRQVRAYEDISDRRLTAIARGLARRLLDDQSAL